jgi:hypothetical protein
VDPKSFAVEDMNYLCACGGKTEAGNFSRIVAGGDCGQVVEQESEARVGPVIEFANTGEREQGKSPLSSRSALIHGRADSGAWIVPKKCVLHILFIMSPHSKSCTRSQAAMR